MERPVRMYPQPGRRGRGEGGEREGGGRREGEGVRRRAGGKMREGGKEGGRRREGGGGREEEGGRRREGRVGREEGREERREEACCSIVVPKVMQGKYTDAFSIQAKYMYTDPTRSMNGVPWLCCAEWRRGR